MANLWRRLEDLEQRLHEAEGSPAMLNPKTVEYLNALAHRKRVASTDEELEEVQEDIRAALDDYQGEGVPVERQM